MKAIIFLVSACAIVGCSLLDNNRNDTTEKLLAASGFRLYPPKDSVEEANLKTIPQRQLLSAKGAIKPTYLYADDEGCDCIYVGGEAEYAQYKKLSQMQRGADARLISATYREGYMTGMGGGGFGVMGGYW